MNEKDELVIEEPCNLTISRTFFFFPFRRPKKKKKEKTVCTTLFHLVRYVGWLVGHGRWTSSLCVSVGGLVWSQRTVFIGTASANIGELVFVGVGLGTATEPIAHAGVAGPTARGFLPEVVGAWEIMGCESAVGVVAWSCILSWLDQTRRR